MKTGIAGNIPKLYLIKISKWFNLVMPIVVLFYQDNDLSMKDIFILKSVYSIGILVMEIPSGYLSDVLGRRLTLLLGAILGTIGFLTYSFSYTFAGFLIAEVILGMGLSFISGSDAAMLYDSLKEVKQERNYLKHEGRITSIGNFAEAFAGVTGGLLATFSLRTPFFFQVLVAGIAIPAAFFMTEPVSTNKQKPDITGVFSAIKTVFVDFQLRTAILFSALIGMSTLTYAWFIQPFFKATGLPLALYGIMWTLLNLTVGTSSAFAYKIERRFGQNSIYAFILLAVCILYIATSQAIFMYGIPILFIFYFVRGIATPVLKDYINKETPSEVRATVLSVRNFVIRVLFAAIGPFAGWINDKYSLEAALATIGTIVLILGMAILIPFFVRKRGNPYLEGTERGA